MATDDLLDDLHGLSGAYALDALEPLERARYERHLETCDQCQAEVADFRETAAMLAAVAAEAAPSTALRSRVLAAVAAERPSALPSVPAPRAPARPGSDDGSDDGSDTVTPLRRTPRRWISLVAAAAVALVVGIGVGVTQPWQDDSPSQVAEGPIARVLAASDAQRVTARLGGGTAEMVRSVSEGKAVVILAGVKAPADGRVYQLWLLRDAQSRPVSAGLVPTGADQEVLLEGDAASAAAAAISVEPVGGSAQPTSDPTLFPFPAQA